MSIIGIIPARGGSKSIPQKNIAPCAGKPLIVYTIEEAVKSYGLDRVILSTDDKKIAKIAQGFDVEIPFLRPKELATDTTPMIHVLQHTLEWLTNQGEDLEALLLLQPTSPLRKSEHIDAAIQLFQAKKADSVVSVVKVPHQLSPISVLKMEKGLVFPFLQNHPLLTRRQDKPIFFARNGPAILIVSTDVIQKGDLYGEQTYGYEMDFISSLDIDSSEDLFLVESVLNFQKFSESKFKNTNIR